MRRRSHGGFTLIEMVLCLVLLGTMLLMAVPAIENTDRRARETEARQALREIRHAIDRYQEDRLRAAAGLAYHEGLPPDLETLVAARYLRRIPRDPLTEDGSWLPVSIHGGGGGLFDVRTRATGRTLDGVSYADL